MRIARPGPGKGWRCTSDAGMASRRPSARTSSMGGRKWRLCCIVGQAHTRTFEQLAQGLDQLELHVLEQAADVVVRLDGGARALEADALDDVRVERALEQPLDLALVHLC